MPRETVSPRRARARSAKLIRVMNIKGKVTSKERFSDLLRALSESGKTGTLIVFDRNVERRLFFEEGAVVAAASTAPGESFGRLLVERAIIQEQALHNAEGVSGARAALLGRRLVDLGVLSEEEIRLSIRLKAKNTIQGMISGPNGSFEFTDERMPNGNRVPVSIDMRSLLSDDAPGPEGNWTARAPTASRESKPPPPQANAPASDPVLAVLERFSERASSTAPAARGRSAQVTAVPPRSRRTFPLLGGALVVASLTLLCAGYWFFQGARSKESGGPPAEPDLVTNHDVPQPSAPSGVGNGEPAAAQGGPAGERREDIPPSAASAAVRQPTALPAPGLARPNDKATPAPAPSPPLQAKPVNERSQVPAPAAAAPSVDKDPSPTSTQQGAAVGTEPAPSPTLSEKASESTPQATATANQEPAPPPGWGSAVFAPKSAVARVSPLSAGVQPGEPVEPGPDVIEPVLLEQPKVKYPDEAKRRKLEAVVRVRVLVDERGTVLQAKVEEPVGYGLDEAAVEAALKARFIPATKGTAPVKMWTVLPLVYRLKK